MRAETPLAAATSPPASASSTAMRAKTPLAAATTPPAPATSSVMRAVKGKTAATFNVLTWNVENLTVGKTKELVLLDLLVRNDVSVAAITETEVPSSLGAFNLAGYTSFLPSVALGDKYRVMMYVRNDVAIATDARLAADIMQDGLQAVWVRLDAHRGCPAMTIGGTYRQWSSRSTDSAGVDRSMPMQKEQLEAFLQQVEMAGSSSRSLIVMGDVNLDAAREEDRSYRLRPLLVDLQAGMARAGLMYHRTGTTYSSHGHYAPSAAALAASASSSAMWAVTPLAAVAAPPPPASSSAMWAATPLAAATAPPVLAKASRTSVIDHIYSAGVSLDVRLLPDAATDHRPVLASLCCGMSENKRLKAIKRRNFKAIVSRDLCEALECYDWSGVYAIKGADDVLAHIMAGIDVALDVVAPVKTITVKEGDPLYLAADTRAKMEERDATAKRGVKYKRLRNEVTRMVRRDRVRSNVDKLAKSRGDPRAIWQIASSAMGQSSGQLPASLRISAAPASATWAVTPLAAATAPPATASSSAMRAATPLAAATSPPASASSSAMRAETPLAAATTPAARAGDVMTVGDAEAATLMNQFYIDKVAKLKMGVSNAPPPPPSSWPETSSTFAWTYTTAGKIKRLINGLGSTGATGPDGVPVSVYKQGVDVLCGPIAHLVNRSLATGVFPEAFKHGVVLPIFKGGRKDRKDPASYRPVSILCALSKVVELVVKIDLQRHLDVSGNVPAAQHGFRKGRSCTTAVAAAHAAWTRGKKEGKVVGVLAFDLSAAFDVCSAAHLLPKLAKIGVLPNAMRWFSSYMAGGYQRVCWNGALSAEVEVLHGVRQGSILGPLLFLVSVADMEACLDIAGNVVFYADDTCIWCCANSVAEVIELLGRKAELFTRYVEGNGLILNAAKSQLMISASSSAMRAATPLAAATAPPASASSSAMWAATPLAAATSPPASATSSAMRAETPLAAATTPTTPSVVVNGCRVFPAKTLNLLGVTFDKTLAVAPHSEMVVAASRQRAGIVARLSHHLPRGEYLRQLAQGLFVGKLGHALPAVVSARLEGSDQGSSSHYKAAQVAMNDVCRTLTGTRRKVHKPVKDLLEAARFKSINAMAVEATAMEAWKAFVSSDGGAGERNPVGVLIFGKRLGVPKNVVRPTRSVNAGIVPVELRGQETFVVRAAEVWNSSPSLRAAKSIGEARRVSRSLARAAPI
jgi:hypothetical protein